MKQLILFVGLMGAIAVAQAQTATDTLQIQQAANDYIDGFYNGDTARIYYSIDTAASKHGYAKSKTDTAYRKVPMSFAGMLRFSKNERNRPSPENAKIREIQILDINSKIAAVKLRLWWGIDYLLLTKLPDRWVIEKVLWQAL